MAHVDLGPGVERKAQEDLLASLTRIDLLEDEKGECSKAFRAIIDEEWARVRTMRGVLGGTVSEQIALPGLEGTSERDARIGAILRKAIESLERITGVSSEVEDMADEAEKMRRRAERTLIDAHERLEEEKAFAREKPQAAERRGDDVAEALTDSAITTQAGLDAALKKVIGRRKKAAAP